MRNEKWKMKDEEWKMLIIYRTLVADRWFVFLLWANKYRK